MYTAGYVVLNKKGGVNSSERFEEYHSYGENVLNTLKLYIPILLRNEEYFSKAFDL